MGDVVRIFRVIVGRKVHREASIQMVSFDGNFRVPNTIPVAFLGARCIVANLSAIQQISKASLSQTSPGQVIRISVHEALRSNVEVELGVSIVGTESHRVENQMYWNRRGHQQEPANCLWPGYLPIEGISPRSNAYIQKRPLGMGGVGFFPGWRIEDLHKEVGRCENGCRNRVEEQMETQIDRVGGPTVAFDEYEGAI